MPIFFWRTHYGALLLLSSWWWWRAGISRWEGGLYKLRAMVQRYVNWACHQYNPGAQRYMHSELCFKSPRGSEHWNSESFNTPNQPALKCIGYDMETSWKFNNWLLQTLETPIKFIFVESLLSESNMCLKRFWKKKNWLLLIVSSKPPPTHK